MHTHLSMTLHCYYKENSREFDWFESLLRTFSDGRGHWKSACRETPWQRPPASFTLLRAAEENKNPDRDVLKIYLRGVLVRELKTLKSTWGDGFDVKPYPKLSRRN